jgi:hypothetical protein
MKICLRKGMLFRTGGHPFELHEFVGQELILRHLLTGEKRLTTESSFFDAIHRGEVNFFDENTALSTALSKLPSPIAATVERRGESLRAVAIMEAKSRWLIALRGAGITAIEDKPWVRMAIERLAGTEMKGQPRFKLSTLAAAARKAEHASGDPLVHLPNYARRGGRGQSRLDPRAEKIVSDFIETRKADKDSVFVTKHLIEKIRNHIDEKNRTTPDALIPVPASSTILRRVRKSISAYSICKINNGADYANRLFRQNGARVDAERPLEVIEIDDVDSKVFLIDDQTSLPCGRAFLTNAIDQHTLVPLGMSVGHEPRNVQSAVECFLDGLLPKDRSRQEFEGTSHPWVGYGFPGVCILDNALYNHAARTRKVMQDLSMIGGWSRPRQPTDKACIEHFNDIIKSDFCPMLRGWTGAEDDEDGIKRGMTGAILTSTAFRRQYTHWIVGVYLNSPGIDGRTPAHRWARFYSDHRPVVQWSREQIALLRMVPQKLRFRASGGVFTMGLRYQSDQFAELERSIGKKGRASVLFDLNDVSYLLAEHPHTRALIRVPCIEDERYTRNVTWRQQALICKAARDGGKTNPSMSDLVAAREALVEMTQQGRRSPQLRRRKASLRNYVEPMEPTPGETVTQETKSRAKEVKMTDLEYNVQQLDAIELDEECAWSYR